ncbi:IS66 family insertion sequence element accessory protein TnpA [Azospirillum sp.]|uniref:IS66 family insertion sequence element accessory protein TnpA n=1 Tax=Azospirillum sp. TaxID=34012 RepID=UPI003D74A12A
MWSAVLVEIIAVRVKHKPGRTCPREVKRKIRTFPTKPVVATPQRQLLPTSQIRIHPPAAGADLDAKARVKRARKIAHERFWWEHIQGWQQSGRTRAEYCRVEKLAPNSFDLWVNCLRHRLRKPQKRA